DDGRARAWPETCGRCTVPALPSWWPLRNAECAVVVQVWYSCVGNLQGFRGDPVSQLLQHGVGHANSPVLTQPQQATKAFSFQLQLHGHPRQTVLRVGTEGIQKLTQALRVGIAIERDAKAVRT